MRILVIEDNQRLASAIHTGLRDEGHEVTVATNGAIGLREGLRRKHDAIVLDLMLPEIHGIAVLGRLRRDGVTTPILILTARDAIADRVAGLDGGADDYLVKPFAFEELLSRLRALVRRRDGRASQLICIGDLSIDLDGKTVSRGGVDIALSAREYTVLACLARRRGRVTTRGQLSDALYDFDVAPASNVVDVFVAHLRKKIEHPGKPKLLHTRRGLGYVLDGPDRESQ